MWWFSTLIALAMGACDGDPGTQPDAMPLPDAEAPAPDATWQVTHVGPATGFVSAVEWAPDGTLWISGDDCSGLYRSTDGGSSLAGVATAPLDWSTYGFAFSPDGALIVAPSHFGRGVAVSTDGGASWAVRTAGLPPGGGDGGRINAALVVGGDILLATGSGLYRGSASGPFTPVAAPALAGAHLTALARTPTGYLAGSRTGRIYASSDAASWTELTTADGPSVHDLVVGSLGTYVAMAGGLVVRLPPAGAPTVVANPATDPRFASTLYTRLAVAPQGGTDRIYLGAVGGAGNRDAGKLLVSTDGGARFEVRAAGLEGASIFDIAVDPADPEHVVLGTIGEGAFVTRDGGATWTPTAGDLRAAAVIGFAQDPADPEHLVIASSESLPGTPSLLERTGGVWTRRRALVEDGRALAFDGTTLLVGGFAAGPTMRASTSGAAGPFTAEPGVAANVTRIVPTTRGTYAAAERLARRSGGTWTTVFDAVTLDVVDLPEGVLRCGLGMHLSASGDFTDAVELPAPAQIWFACARDATGALLATANGELWTAPSLEAARTSTGWTRVVTPLDGVQLLSARAAGTTWFIGGGEVDANANATSSARSGLLYSEDRGATWTPLHGALWPSRTVYMLHAGRDEHELFVGLWGGSLWAVRRAP